MWSYRSAQAHGKPCWVDGYTWRIGTDYGETQIGLGAGLWSLRLQSKQTGRPLAVARAGSEARAAVDDDLIADGAAVNTDAGPGREAHPLPGGNDALESLGPGQAELRADEMKDAQVIPQAPGSGGAAAGNRL